MLFRFLSSLYYYVSMIKSTVVKIKKINEFENLYIEAQLNKLYKDVVRWAVVDVSESDIFVSVSYVE